MTTTPLLQRPAPIAATAPYRRLATPWPWLVAAGALGLALVSTGTPVLDIVRYAGYWTLAVLLPGTLVHRALRGSRGNLPEDVGHGAVVGLLLELGAWALAAATGLQPTLRWWPLVVLALFAAVPALRRHWRVATPRPMPLHAAWALAAVLVLVTALAALRWAATPLPPATAGYYQDLLYHLALVQELTRSMPFEVPQLAGEPLHYHYLSDAHLASASMIAGVAPPTVLLRLWLVPVVAATALVTAGLARDLTGRWWAGPVAAAGSCLGLPLALGAPVTAMGGSPVSYVSPSQTYAVPFSLLLVGLCADVLRGRRLDASWVLVPALGLACAGAKASALPPVVAGVLLAGLVHGWRARRAPWPVLAVLGALVGALGLGTMLFVGGGAGTLQPQLFSVLRWTAPYRQTLGAHDGITAGGLLPAGLATAGVRAWLFVLAILGWWLLMQLPRLVGLAGLATPRLRGDPVAWLLSGALAAGFVASWTLFHPSASQVYFAVGVVPFGVLLSVWLLADAAPGRRVLVGGFVGGAVASWVLPTTPSPANTWSAWGWALALPTLRALAIGLAVAVLIRAANRLRGGPPAVARPAALGVAGVVTTVLLGGSVGAGVDPVIHRATSGSPGARQPGEREVTRDEMSAALWLDANADADDVVATNVHCQPVRTTPRCDARAFWVTGLGGHRSVVESWGYSDAAVAAHGRERLSYPRQAPPDPQLFALNERVFVAPTAADLARLRYRHGVRWLFADARAGAVSPELARLAQLRLVSGPVTIYQLR